MRYNKFDIVMFKKIHYNEFLPGMMQRKKFANRLLKEKNAKWLYKMRPAIVLKVFIPKFRDEKGKLTRYLIAPLTSKNSIKSWVGGAEFLRIKFENEGMKPAGSYIMLDSIMTICGKDIDSLYNNKGKRVKITTAKQRWLKKQFKKKFKKLMKSI